MKKKIITISSVIVIIIIVILGVLKLVFNGSEKLVCKSNEGSITIYYKKNKLEGYTKKGRFSYNLDEQEKIVEKIGIEKYLENFEEWFLSSFQNGKCEKK